MAVEKTIEEYKRIVENKIVSAEAAHKKFDELVELQRIKNKRLKGEKLTENDVQCAMNLLCWGNYAGCCGPSKQCPWNAAVSDALGIDYEELYEEKKKTVREFLSKSKLERLINLLEDTALYDEDEEIRRLASALLKKIKDGSWTPTFSRGGDK